MYKSIYKLFDKTYKLDRWKKCINYEKKNKNKKYMTQYISIFEIYSKIKNKSDIINYFREQGMLIYII